MWIFLSWSSGLGCDTVQTSVTKLYAPYWPRSSRPIYVVQFYRLSMVCCIQQDSPLFLTLFISIHKQARLLESRFCFGFQVLKRSYQVSPVSEKAPSKISTSCIVFLRLKLVPNSVHKTLIFLKFNDKWSTNKWLFDPYNLTASPF